MAPSTFQQVMYTMLGNTDFLIAYMDDIRIKGESQRQQYVFEKIKEHQFKR